MKTFLADSHCHLTEAFFAGNEDVVLERARAVGAGLFACCAARPPLWRDTIKFASSHEGVAPVLGLHPWFCAEVPADWKETLETLFAEHPFAVGECGLDAVRGPEPEVQEAALSFQLEFAARHKVPVVIHCVQAWGRLAELLEPYAPFANGLVLHSYGGGAGMVSRFAKMGAYFSFSPAVANERMKKMRGGALAAPQGRILFESDAPYGRPERDGEPADTAASARACAFLRGEDFTVLGLAAKHNWERIFGRFCK